MSSCLTDVAAPLLPFGQELLLRKAGIMLLAETYITCPTLQLPNLDCPTRLTKLPPPENTRIRPYSGWRAPPKNLGRGFRCESVSRTRGSGLSSSLKKLSLVEVHMSTTANNTNILGHGTLHKSAPTNELLSKLLVFPLITPIVVPYIIPYITPFKEFRLWLK